MVLGKHSAPRRPTNLEYSRAWAYCACSGCGWGGGLLGHFCLSSFISLFFLPLSWRRPDRLKYCLKGLLSPKQPTNKPDFISIYFVLLHGPSMLPDKAKFVVCSIISVTLSFWMKDLVIGQLQRPAKFSAFHWSTSRSQAFICQLLGTAG